MCNDEKILQDMSYKVINDYVEARKNMLQLTFQDNFINFLKNISYGKI